MKFLIVLVALFIFCVLLVAVLHDPQPAQAEAEPEVLGGAARWPETTPAVELRREAEPNLRVGGGRPIQDIVAVPEHVFFERIGPRMEPRPAEPVFQPTVQPNRSPYVLDLSDRD